MKNYERQEKLLKLFANKRRLMILRVLERHQRASVGFIAEQIKLSFRSTSKHLQLLEDGGLITSSEEGLYRIYEISRPRGRLIRSLFVLL